MNIPKKNAGYTIRNCEMYRKEKNRENYVILAENEKSKMWVTWECTNGTNFYWGHYFESKMQAYMDYHKRLLDNYNMPWEE